MFDQLVRRNRPIFLLCAIVFLILARPFENEGLFAGIIYLAVFCAGGSLVAASRLWFISYVAVAIPALVIGTISLSLPSVGALVLVGDILTLLISGLLFFAVVRFALFGEKATEMERIIAGISSYLILGFLWANLYSIHEDLFPGGFQSLDGEILTRETCNFLYFSFVTLTTLGYGDVIPIASLARALAILEAACGTLFVAVFIASLVSGKRGLRE